jgi:DNA-binding NarL/FixJ family response regulator
MLDVSQGEVVRLVDTDRPDVVVADMITRELKVIVVSSRAKELYVRKALQSGALRYLLDDPSVVEVGLPLDSLARYEHPSPGAARTHVDAARAEIALTPRQREVLTLIARGRSTKEIALDLDLSVKTVETHRAQLMERLGIREVAGLVRYAIRRGLVPEE